LTIHSCFPSWCNVAISNALVLVLSFKIKIMLACVRFHSWCNVFIGNVSVLVIEGKNKHKCIANSYIAP
jgi:hypothetical protein